MSPPTRRCGPPCPTRRTGSASDGSRSCRRWWRSTASPWRRTPAGSCSTGSRPPARIARPPCVPPPRPRLFREPVLDRTRLADGAPPGLGDALAAAAPLVVSLAAGEVAVTDRTLTLTGESLYRENAARAPERLAEALRPGWTGQAAV